MKKSVIPKAIVIACSLLCLSPIGTHASEDQDKIFDESLKKIFPLSPKQSQKILGKTIEQQKSSRLSQPKEVRSRSQKFSLKPGAKVETVHIRANYPCVLVFLDSTGQPWPIHSALVGNSDWFEVIKPETEPKNVVIIDPKTYEGNSGMLVMLSPNIPVNLQLSVNVDQIPDRKIIFRADEKGPNAAIATVSKLPEVVDQEILNVLYGVPPEKAYQVVSDNPNVTIWSDGETMYIRSPFKLIWPDYYLATQNGEGEGGMYAYKTSIQPQILVAGEDREPFHVNIDYEKRIFNDYNQ